MASIIDISKKITNETPTVKITEDIIVNVNNRKNNILCIQEMIAEEERKAKRENKPLNEMELINKALKLLVGGTKADAIDNLNLPLPEYKLVYQSLMQAATGTTPEEESERFQK